MNNISTPRTNVEEARVSEIYGAKPGQFTLVSADFARQLERELNEALGQLKRNDQHLRDWLDSHRKYFPPDSPAKPPETV